MFRYWQPRRKKDEVRIKVLEGFDPMARLDRKNAASHRDVQLSKDSTFQEVANLWYYDLEKRKNRSACKKYHESIAGRCVSIHRKK